LTISQRAWQKGSSETTRLEKQAILIMSKIAFWTLAKDIAKTSSIIEKAWGTPILFH
jgi:hypothetical protein